MSDSPPPDGGPDPFDGWDLDGLLAGENVWLPHRMLPVRGTLDSLRSGPSRAELAGEAAARSLFREVMLAGRTEPAPPGDSAGQAGARILPQRAAEIAPWRAADAGQRADAGPRVVARGRHTHRRPPRRRRWRPRTLLGAAGGTAAVVIVGGAALAGVFSGGGQPGLFGHNSAATSAAPQTSGARSNGLEGSATKEPTASPVPSHPASRQSSSGPDNGPGASELCRQYLSLIEGQEAGSGWAGDTSSAKYRQLSDMAGGAWHILGYCLALQPWATKDSGSYSGVGFPPPHPRDASGLGGSQEQGKLRQSEQGNPQSTGGLGGSGSGSGGSSGNAQGAAISGTGNQGQ